MSDQIVADAADLRRIALLITRAADESAPPALRQRLARIADVIDHMKRAVVLQRPFEDEDLERLAILVAALPQRCCDPSSGTEIVRSSAIRELRELVSSC